MAGSRSRALKIAENIRVERSIRSGAYRSAKLANNRHNGQATTGTDRMTPGRSDGYRPHAVLGTGYDAPTTVEPHKATPAELAHRKAMAAALSRAIRLAA